MLAGLSDEWEPREVTEQRSFVLRFVETVKVDGKAVMITVS